MRNKFLQPQKTHSLAKRESNREKISINLGVKRITIDDLLLSTLPAKQDKGQEKGVGQILYVTRYCTDMTSKQEPTRNHRHQQQFGLDIGGRIKC